MKTCNRCGQSKPLDEFAMLRTSRDGRRSTCKSCMNRRKSVSGWRGPTARLPSSISRQVGL